jgi:hypothetical protein
MSIKQMNLVWESSKHGGTLLLLMLAIANNANDEGDAYPGQEYLAKKIRKSEPYTREMIVKLMKSKELRLTHQGGSGAGDPNHYRIILKERRASPSNKERRASPSNKERRASPEGAVKERLRGGDHAQKKAEPHRTIRTNNITSSPPPPPAAMMPPATAVGVGELEKVPPTLEETIWTWKAIPNIPARSIQTHAHGPDKFIALYLYYLTQSGIKSPLRAALARLGRGEIDPGQIFEQIGELPPTSLAILLNWLAEGASDYTTTDLNGAGVLGHAFAELFKQPPSGIQSRPQQERQAEAEQQTIRSVAVHALTDLNLWRLLPTIEPVGPTLPDVVMPDRQVSDPDPVLPPNAETWQAVLDQLWLEMSHATFDAWIRETELSSIGPDRFVIGVPTTYARDWLENRMTATIARTLALLTGNNWPVKFIVKGK